MPVLALYLLLVFALAFAASDRVVRRDVAGTAQGTIAPDHEWSAYGGDWFQGDRRLVLKDGSVHMWSRRYRARDRESFR